MQVAQRSHHRLDGDSLACGDFNGVPLSEAILRGFRALLQFHAPPTGMDDEQQLELLRALSGDAFHICHAVHWQEMAYLQSPTDPVANIARSCGLSYEFCGKGPTGMYMRRPDAATTTATDLESLYAQIDSGNPVLTAGAIENCGNYSLVIGYNRQGPMLCHVGDLSSTNEDGTPFEGGLSPRWSLVRGVSPGAVDADAGFHCVDGQVRGVAHSGGGGWAANPFYFLRPDATNGRAHWPTASQSARITLLLAVELYRAPPIKQVYHFGASAYEEWARSLRRLRYPAHLDVPAPYEGSPCYEMGNMASQLYHIAHCRPAAAAFCEQAAASMPGAAAALLRSAARAYRNEAALAASSPAFGPFAPLHRHRQQTSPAPVDLLTDPMAEWLSDTVRSFPPRQAWHHR
jgi:hypothetical protein|eukprot:COSAG02_NODE_5655_length_4148_cov_172.597184_6_plen_403_part_00